jgi:hypothetical protein
VKILPVTLFRKLVILKLVPKAGHYVHWRKSTNEREGKRGEGKGGMARGNKNLMRLIFRSSK